MWSPLPVRGFDFCLSTSIPVLTTSTYVVAWPQGDHLLGGGPWHKANLPATHWLSLPFYTPEGAWPLSQSTWVQRWSSILQTVVVTPPESKLASCCHHQDFSVNILASTTAPATAPAFAPASAPASAPAAAPAAEPREGGFVVDLPYQMHNNYDS